MISLVTAAFDRIKGWLTAGLALLVAIGAAFLAGHRKGSKTTAAQAQAERVRAENAVLTDALDAAKERNRVEDEIARMPAGDPIERLLRDWSRD